MSVTAKIYGDFCGFGRCLSGKNKTKQSQFYGSGIVEKTMIGYLKKQSQFASFS